MIPFQFEDRFFSYASQTEGEHIGERRIEIPLALDWVTRNSNGSTFIEIGAVLPYWARFGKTEDPMQVAHTVIDPYDKYPFGIRVDAEAVDYTGRDVLSISTIEHIGRVEYGETLDDPEKAVRVLRKLLEQAKKCFVTWPVGYNLVLDEFGKTLPDVKMLKQVTDANEWVQILPDWNLEYNRPRPFGNGLVVVEK